ncbi:MAG: YgjP-like metallopeptidase domain-containing protein, partial [Pseudomonadales bacterium]
RYPLHVSASGRVSVSFGDDGWRVEVRNVDNSEQIQKALEQWYRRQAVEYYEERMFVCFERFPNWFQDKYRVPNITIRKMRRCWGSCARNGGVTLNLSLIKMPVQCVDYVITHELCHVEAFHHGKAFYHLLASVMPTWREREALIEQLGIHTV